MWKKTLLAGTAALAIAGSSLVYAQQQSGAAATGGPAGSGDQPAAGWRSDHDGRGGLSPQDRAAFLDARIAGVKAGLQLTPDQEKNWPAFETAWRNLAKLRAEHRQARLNQEQQPANQVERLRRQAEALASFGAGLKQLADAEEPLLASLDEAQKRRFAMFAHMQRERMAFMRDREGWRGMRERMWRWRHGGFGGGDEGGWRGRGDGGWRGGDDGGWHGGGPGRSEHGADSTNGSDPDEQ